MHRAWGSGFRVWVLGFIGFRVIGFIGFRVYRV